MRAVRINCLRSFRGWYEESRNRPDGLVDCLGNSHGGVDMTKPWEKFGISRATFYRRKAEKGPYVLKTNRRSGNIIKIWEVIDPEWLYTATANMSNGDPELQDYLLDYAYTVVLEDNIESPKAWFTARLRNRVRDFIKFRKKFVEFDEEV